MSVFRALALAFCATAGCGLDLRGELLGLNAEPNAPDVQDSAVAMTADHSLDRNVDAAVVPVPDATSPSESNAAPPEASTTSRRLMDDAPVILDAVAPLDAASATTVDAVVDVLSPTDGGDEFASLDSDATTDADSSCTRLSQCCQDLMMTTPAPPILAACLASQNDADDAGSCYALLAAFMSAGLCH
jgi:hypothetical protein